MALFSGNGVVLSGRATVFVVARGEMASLLTPTEQTLHSSQPIAKNVMHVCTHYSSRVRLVDLAGDVVCCRGI